MKRQKKSEKIKLKYTHLHNSGNASVEIHGGSGDVGGVLIGERDPEGVGHGEGQQADSVAREASADGASTVITHFSTSVRMCTLKT